MLWDKVSYTLMRPFAFFVYPLFAQRFPFHMITISLSLPPSLSLSLSLFPHWLCLCTSATAHMEHTTHTHKFNARLLAPKHSHLAYLLLFINTALYSMVAVASRAFARARAPVFTFSSQLTLPHRSSTRKHTTQTHTQVKNLHTARANGYMLAWMHSTHRRERIVRNQQHTVLLVCCLVVHTKTCYVTTTTTTTTTLCYCGAWACVCVLLELSYTTWRCVYIIWNLPDPTNWRVCGEWDRDSQREREPAM